MYDMILNPSQYYDKYKPQQSVNPNSLGLEYEIPLLRMKRKEFTELKKNGDYSRDIMTLASEDAREGGKGDIYFEFVSQPMSLDTLGFLNDIENDFDWFKKENKYFGTSMTRTLGQRSKFRFIDHIKYLCKKISKTHNIKEYSGTPQITFGIQLKLLPKLYREICNLMDNQTQEYTECNTDNYYMENKEFIQKCYPKRDIESVINNAISNYVGFLFLCMHYISIFDASVYSIGTTDNNTGMKGSPYIMNRFSFTYLFNKYLSYEEQMQFIDFANNFDSNSSKMFNRIIKISMYLHTKKNINNNYFETSASNFLKSIYDNDIRNSVYQEFIIKFNQQVEEYQWRRYIFDKNNISHEIIDDCFIAKQNLNKDIFSPPLGELYPDGDIFYKYEHENIYERETDGKYICKNSMGCYDYYDNLNSQQRENQVVLLECRRLTPRQYTIDGFEKTLTKIHEHICKKVLD